MKNIELLTVEELASILKVAPSWIYRKVREGRIPYRKFGHYLRFELESVLAHFEGNTRGCNHE